MFKQRGVALIAFTVALSIVTFTIVLGYAVATSKKQASSLVSNQKAYLKDVRAKLVEAYSANSASIDADFSWTSISTGDAVLELAGVAPRWGLTVAISPPILREGVKFRAIAAWLPLDTVDLDPPSLGTDGTFNPCPLETADCVGRREFVVVSDGFSIQRNNSKKATSQLEQLAENGQAFFNAKVLLDPERNVSVNYFRPPFGGCSPLAEQVPCVDSPYPVYSDKAYLPALRNSTQTLAELLGLPNVPLLNPWGAAIEVCNGPNCGDGPPSLVKWDPVSQGAPYTTLFQSSTPWGSTLRVYSLQKL
jgi:hypothetical protein